LTESIDINRMTAFTIRRFTIPTLAAVLSFAAIVPVPAADNLASGKPVLLYSRYYNAEGETRYLPDGTFKDVLGRMREHFDVRVHAKALTKETLADVRLVLIANPSDKAVGNRPAPPHFSPADIRSITRFVEAGGGLIIMGNQEDHNLEVEDTNKLLVGFGIQFTNLYTDAKQLILPQETPVIGGLRWAYYTGNLLRLDSAHAGRPRPLVPNDLAQRPLKGTRDQPGVLLATADPGKGRVVAVTDSGWITDDALSGKGIGGVSITEQDNWEIFLRLANWAADPRAK
jgi:hypothetical protein